MPKPQLVVGAIIVDSLTAPSRLMAARRSTPPLGAWEFPGGKVEPDETAQAALIREIREELGVSIEVGDEFASPAGAWPISQRYELRLFFAVASTEPQPGDSHDALTWLGWDELDSVEWLPSDAAAVAELSG